VQLVFLLKPLVPARRPPPPGLEVKPEAAPLLFCLVETLAGLVGSPMPKRVFLTVEPNAAAGLRRGFWSLLSGNDFTLILGTPLIAGMSTRALAGVIAHELAHFRQGMARFLGYIIETVNGWFLRVVYERDAWDLYLKDMSEAGPFLGQVVFKGARVCLWLTRAVLKVFAHAAHAVSSGLSRQQEFDADRCEALGCGSACASDTLLNLGLLAAGAQPAYADIDSGVHDMVFPEDFGTLICDKANSMPPEFRLRVIEATLDERHDLHSSHPSVRQRQERISALNAPGVFVLDRSATDLFPDFHKTSVETTLAFYRGALGQGLRRTSMVPNADFRQRYGWAQFESSAPEEP
jgi:Zn-dependent protease with chaperone function